MVHRAQTGEAAWCTEQVSLFTHSLYLFIPAPPSLAGRCAALEHFTPADLAHQRALAFLMLTIPRLGAGAAAQVQSACAGADKLHTSESFCSVLYISLTTAHLLRGDLAWSVWFGFVALC